MYGGIEHVPVHFDDETIESLAIYDKIMIKVYGQGFKLEVYDDIHVMSIAPNLFEKIGIYEKNGKIQVPVVAKIASYLMGSGIESSNSYTGGYDIMTAYFEEIKRLGLDKLRFGYIVLLEDCDNTYVRGYLKGAFSIGVIVHGDCVTLGYGPGVTTIIVSKNSLIEGIIDENANIVNYIEK
nr:DUF4438 domain-containing protein [[Eubacterium] tenue]